MKPYQGKYSKSNKEPYKVSRSKIEDFIKCPRCFYLDRVCGIPRPGIPSFNINSAVDTLLKKEFDLLREKGQSHKLMDEYGLKLIPFKHEMMDEWRRNFHGVQTYHKQTNLFLYGAVDDVWVDGKGVLHIVDYKSTSTEKEIDLNDKWKEAYKRQMEIYQWLMRQNGFKVSDTGYFFYCNGKTNNPKFDGRIDFDIQIIEYRGDDSWVEPTILKLKKCLDSNKIPDFTETCELCMNVKQSMQKLPGKITL